MNQYIKYQMDASQIRVTLCDKYDDENLNKFSASIEELQNQINPAKTFRNKTGNVIKKCIYDGNDLRILWCVVSESAYRAQQDGYPYDITVTRRENEGFGFVIISSVTRAGSVIGE